MENVEFRKISSSGQLAELFRKAQAEKTPVRLYGRPKSGEISLDFSEWRNVELFDAENLMIIVPPGILLKDLADGAAAQGLRFIPADTPLLADLSVGEWAYRGCPNPSAWKYGAGKQFLLGATYVFPTGEIVPVGGKCIKNVSGYDFTRFFTGAYADLAVGVQFILRLLPQPEYRYRYDVTFSSLTDGARLVSALQSRSVPPAWLYWFDAATGSRLFGRVQHGERVLFELEGNENEVRGHAAAIDSFLAGMKCQVSPEAASLPDVSHLESCDDAFWLMDEFKLPYAAVPALAASLSEDLGKHSLAGGLFGQLADGKIHIGFDQPLSPAVGAVIANLQKETSRLGGAVSGNFDRLYGSPAATPLLSLETTLKKHLDPELIFNRRRGLA